MEHAHRGTVHRAILALAACAAAATLAFVATAAVAATPAKAATDYSDAYTIIKGNVHNATYGLFGKPGEKVNWSYTAKKTVWWNPSTGEDETISGVSYTWTSAKKLNAVIDGKTITIKKLPKKIGKYKIKVTAKDAEGATVCTNSWTVTVKKKPKVKIKMLVPNVGHASTAKKGDNVMLMMQGASFGWNNNTKKPFYTWKIKNLDNGKTATFSKKGKFKSNSIIKGSSVAGGGVPVTMATFKKTGKYKITGIVYHHNKKLVTVTKTIKVK